MKHIIILNCGPGLTAVRNEFGIAVEWIQRKVDVATRTVAHSNSRPQKSLSATSRKELYSYLNSSPVLLSNHVP